MPEQPQIIVKPDPAPNKQFGARKDANLTSAFPNSPIYTEDITNEERRKAFNQLALDEIVLNGNGINSFSRDYDDAPNLEDVQTGGGGLPASPYMPNLASPGPGSVNPADQPAYNGNIPTADEKQTAFGTGLGGTTSPSDTSSLMKEVGSIGEYISGRSYQGSDGQS